MKKFIYIMNMWYTKHNYGAKLTGYALHSLVNDIFEDNFLINLQEYLKFNKNFSKYKFDDFDKKYIKSVTNGFNYSNLYKYNNFAIAYIVGSDQIWRYGKNNPFLLNFCPNSLKKIAFSASYGVNKEEFLQENSQNTIEQMKNSLKSFDFISVREKSGVEICRDLFDVKAEWIIDPVFILDKKNWDELINDASGKILNQVQNDVIVSYVLDTNKEYKKAYKYLSKQYNAEVVELANSNESVENWLKAIRDCKFLITDSFHGMCFAIIFNKPFICLANKKRGATRFESILEMLNIDYQCIDSVNEIYKKDCIFKVDYNIVNKRIEEERQKGLDFLKMALEAPVQVTQEKIVARMKFLENKVCELEQKYNFYCLFKDKVWQLWKIIFYSLPIVLQEKIRKIRGK